MNEYGRDYYVSSNYASYLERQGRYRRLVHELTNDLFEKISLNDEFKHGFVLDYGCAVGYVVKAFQESGYKNCYGYDVSEWAIEHAKNVTEAEFVSSEGYPHIEWDLVLAFDVLEHMDKKSLNEFFSSLYFRHIVVRIPVSREDDGRFVLDVSENDKTHVTRLTKESWISKFKQHGYDVMFRLNLNNIYDSEGVFCAMLRRRDV